MKLHDNTKQKCDGNCFSESLALHPSVLAVVSQLIGSNILVRNGDVFAKRSGNTHEIDWHVDSPFSWSKSMGMINCWIALNDVDENRGALQYISGSHRHVFQREPPDKYHLTLEREQLEELDLRSTSCNVMPMGHMSIHSFRTVHASGKNMSDLRRIGLVIRFMSAETTPTVAETGQAFLAQGQPGIWTNKLRNYFPISWNIQ